MGEQEANELAAEYGVRLRFCDLPGGAQWGAMPGVALCSRRDSVQNIFSAIRAAKQLESLGPGRPM